MTDRRSLLKGFELGEWLVTPADGSLVSSRRVTRLEPLLMELLVFLCSNAGQVVSKQDVLGSVWPDRYVSDDTVKASFYQLRKALGDTPRNPRFIETLPKRGYRFLIEPVAMTESGDLQDPGTGVEALYRKGESLLSGEPSAAALKQARLYFERVIEVEPEHVKCLSALAHTYIHLVTLVMARGAELLPRAQALAMRAVQLDPKLARAHVALAISQLLHERDRPQAEKRFRLAIELDPADALPHQWYAKLLSSQRRHEEAIFEGRQALRVDPLSLVVRRELIEALLGARRYEETITESHRLMEMAGHAPDVQLGLAWVYFLMDDQARAFHSLCAGFRSLGIAPAIISRAAKAFKEGGMLTVFQLWAKVMQEQTSLGQQSIDLLVLHALLGEADQCFKLLALAEKQFHPVILWLPVSPLFDKLRPDRRYGRLLLRIGFAEQ